jgi:hypothetical protein
VRRALVVALCLLAGSAVSARTDECDGVMAALVSAQRDAQASIENVDALEAAIVAPSWDPVADGWMLDALGWAIDELVTAFNAVAVAEARAHEAHCY